MSVSLGRALQTNPLPGSSKTIRLTWIYVLVTLNLMISILVGLFLISQDGQSWQFFKASQDYSEPEPGFLFHDLPLPGWAQGFIMPITGAVIPDNPNLLPGAPRGYRNGTHEGVDIFCPFGTQVMAAKDGYVIFTGSHYLNTPFRYRKRLLQISKHLFRTPPEILDLLHGRRVILDHGLTNGRWVASVYSHLSGIEEGIKVGGFASQGTVLGDVGNTGTSKAGTVKGAHLHFEIRVNGHFLGQGMTPKEAGLLFKAILEGNYHAKPNRKTNDQTAGRHRLSREPERQSRWKRLWQRVFTSGPGR